MDITQTAYKEAVRVLNICIDKAGMKASGLTQGYPEVWARDSMITLIGATLLDGALYKECMCHSLKTMKEYQSELGMIPLNVDTRNMEATTLNAGGIDANLWYVIGHYVNYQRYGDRAFLAAYKESIDLAVLWLRYQDANGCGLLEVHEAADWADLFGNRYNVLYDNVLYAKALDCYAKILDILGHESCKFHTMAADVKEKINFLMRRQEDYSSIGRMVKERGYCQEWERSAVMTWSKGLGGSYYLPYVAFQECGSYMDTLGNCLAILFEIADRKTANNILNFIQKLGANRPYPVMAIYPPVYPGEKDWREYYRKYELNYPFRYHNGGIWPYIGGIYVAALVKAGRIREAQTELEHLASANKQGLGDEQWDFTEWMDGKNGMASGHRYQAWSAGMYVFAQKCVEEKKVLL